MIDWLVAPETERLVVVPSSVEVAPVTVEVAMLSRNRKSEFDPVSTNLFPLFSTTSKVTFAPLCVSVTVPNAAESGTNPLPPSPGLHEEPVIWHDVRRNVSAELALGNAALIASNAAPPSVIRVNVFMMISHT